MDFQSFIVSTCSSLFVAYLDFTNNFFIAVSSNCNIISHIGNCLGLLILYIVEERQQNTL